MKSATRFLQALHGNNLVAQKHVLKRELGRFKAALELERTSWPRDIQTMLVCIHQHLFEPTLKVLEVRRRCGFKNNNISTYFRQAVGMGMREYIEDKRMQAARQLLAHEELEIFLIGLGVGYSHEESFTRAFRRCCGYSPSAYRKKIRQKKC